jgi:uncharacterized protein YkwD
MPNNRLWSCRAGKLAGAAIISSFIVLCSSMAPAFAAPPRDISPTNPTASGQVLNVQEQKAVMLLNAARKEAGLEPLKVNLPLSRLAANYAMDMNTRKFFAHVDPDGKDPFERMAAIGIDYPNAGENIALSPDVETANKMLLDSPLHRENILNPKFTEIGIGVRPDSRGGVYLVQEFIGP